MTRRWVQKALAFALLAAAISVPVVRATPNDPCNDVAKPVTGYTCQELIELGESTGDAAVEEALGAAEQQLSPHVTQMSGARSRYNGCRAEGTGVARCVVFAILKF